jgi:two-component system, LytTR family, sensor kinase
LSSLVLKQQPALANKFIEAFSRVYRTLLENHDKELIPLREEMEFLDSYMYLLKQRFPDSIHFEWEITQRHKQMHIIPAALQLLVENSIKHNTTSPSNPLYITIRSTADNNLEVINNKQLRRSTQEKATGIGLANIENRYKLILNKEIIVTETKTEFIVKLPLAKVENYVNESRDN